MSEPAWWAEARRLYAKHGTYAEVARRLARTPEGVRYALNPAVRPEKAAYKREWRRDPINRERDNAFSQRWKDEHREQNRARDNARLDALATAVCDCGNRIFDDAERCGSCRRSSCRRERCERIVEWWAQGLTLQEIADKLGWTRNHLGQEFFRMRADGYNLPYRYKPREKNATKLPEQVAA